MILSSVRSFSYCALALTLGLCGRAETTSPIVSLPLPLGFIGIFAFVGVILSISAQNPPHKVVCTYPTLLQALFHPETVMTHAFPVPSGCRFALMPWSTLSWEEVVVDNESFVFFHVFSSIFQGIFVGVFLISSFGFRRTRIGIIFDVVHWYTSCE